MTKIMKTLKMRAKEIIISVVFYFQHILKFVFPQKMHTIIGNLDVTYLLAPTYLIQKRKSKRFWVMTIATSGAALLYAIMQALVFPQINILKSFITVGKLVICVLIMFFIKENYDKIKFLSIAKIISILYAISLPVALIFNKSSLFWITNDEINKYTTTRLRFFYAEPSELGFRVIIILVILLGFFFTTHSKKEKCILGFCIVINALTLFFARSMGAIGVGALAIAVMFLFDWITNNSKTKTIVYCCFVAIIVLLFIWMATTQSPLYMRLIDTFQGRDSSNNYRIILSFRILADSFPNYYGLGCGFGNVNTPEFMLQYKNWGMVTIITNSFVYFIVETGVLGILLLGLGMLYLIKCCVQSKSAVKWGLFTFIIVFQFMGGYFTNGLNWIVYGMIISDFHEKKSIVAEV